MPDINFVAILLFEAGLREGKYEEKTTILP